jgi:hypothetical protein
VSLKKKTAHLWFDPVVSKQKRPAEKLVFFVSGAADRNRTGTTVARREILNPKSHKKQGKRKIWRLRILRCKVQQIRR